MSWFEAISGFLVDLSWPAVVVLLVFILRQPIVAVMQAVAERAEKVTAKAAGFSVVMELSARKELEALAEKSPLEGGTLTPEIAAPPPAATPVEIVEKAYSAVEQALSGRAAPLQASRQLLIGLEIGEIAEYLAGAAVLDQATASAVRVLTSLRSQALHAGGVGLTTAAAEQFQALAQGTVSRILAPR